MILLIAQLSAHIHQLPSFIGVNMAGTAYKLMLSLFPFLQQVLNLLLQDCALFQTQSIVGQVGQAIPRDQIDLVLDIPHRRQPIW